MCDKIIAQKQKDNNVNKRGQVIKRDKKTI